MSHTPILLNRIFSFMFLLMIYTFSIFSSSHRLVYLIVFNSKNIVKDIRLYVYIYACEQKRFKNINYL